MKNVTLSSVFHSARRRGCTLVVNLKPAFSLIKTIPAGTEALKGETILHIPEKTTESRGKRQKPPIENRWSKIRDWRDLQSIGTAN